MKIMELLTPAHKRKVALILLLCWVIPFMGVLSFSMLSTGRVLGESGENVALEGDRPSPEEKIQSDLNKEKKVKEDSSQQEEIAQSNNPALEIKRGTASQDRKTVTTATRPSAPPPISSPVLPDRGENIDLDLLARVIYGEAGGEPYEGQVAVGAVLVNRVASPNFPNNLWNIVFKKGEFCTVRDGQVWLRPDATAYQAAKLAKAGWDPSHGALYFYNPGKTTSKWIWSRTVTTQIGSHLFAR